MKVKGKQEVEIELSPEMIKHIVLEFLYSNFNWGSQYFIENGKVSTIQEFATTHRWTENKVIRNADNIDKCLYALVKEIKKI